ncbi:hypothetical protein K443DRAFT_123883 [Laccaria amethystina LaAM-08-1]|uniref:Unplaced genomic scaffold K443scaffold_145, whole genome shotgun sequence n=1 Tax=Laccaria amethystina LaAM-08-1 TaxID=1095629 RepID=A0A0C9WYK8_9AGAR|nr:hypothetical protein K443DRAFT_123883 [Laccaria amethystina LaAM-08-1]
MDNATNNNTLMASLEHELRAWGIVFDRVENRIRCFPHVVNLACKAVLAALSHTNYVEDESAEGTTHSDPIGTLHALVQAIHASSLQRQHFAEIAKNLSLELQLLALILEKVLEDFFLSQEFEDLQRYRLSDLEWEALAMVPDAFQQKLSAEKRYLHLM